MKYALRALPLGVLLSAAVSCAGTLDENENYFAGSKQAPVRAAAGGGAGKSAWNAGGAGGWGSAGSAGSAWRDAGSPSAQDSERGDSQDDDAGVPMTSGVNRSWGGAGGSAGAWAAAGKGAAGAAAGSGGTAAAGSCDFRGLVMQKCSGASCHGGPTASTGLDLTTAMLAQRVQGRHGTGSCTDKLVVDKDNPAQSKLYLKVSGSDCGVKMPLGGSLTDAEQSCVLSWIEGL